MYAALMVVFASVIGAAALAVLGSRMSRAEKRINALVSDLRMHLIETKPSEKMAWQAIVAGEVDALRGAVDSLRSSNRSEFGRIWRQLRGREPDVIDGEVLDPGVDEMIRFQSKNPSVTPRE